MLLDRGVLALTVRHVLILRALGLGDFLTGVPAYRALRSAYPDAVLRLAAPAYLQPLIGLTGALDHLQPTDGLGRLGRVDPRPDLAVNLHGSGPDSIDDLVATGARHLITHRHPLRREVSGPDWTDDLHEVRRWCRLLGCHGIPADPRDLCLSVPDVPPRVADAVVVHPGAAAPARRWPAERFGAVARRLVANGQQVVVTGTSDEVSAAAIVVGSGGLPPKSNLCGELDVGQLAALVATARLVICGDTGVAHLASAYGTPSVLLFGPTPPSQWGPPADGPHTVLWHGSSGDPHGDQPDPGLLGIGVEDVLAAACRRLAQPATAAGRRGSLVVS
ncbi:MAG TPA: glycosyltransferase family 9 protein [Propionibacteriaceae bacterium]|nr:glycosyltransferase family 9 protein [Propionibacteriaceae bacterium]